MLESYTAMQCGAGQGSVVQGSVVQGRAGQGRAVQCGAGQGRAGRSKRSHLLESWSLFTTLMTACCVAILKCMLFYEVFLTPCVCKQSCFLIVDCVV